ncbi:MAG: ATP-binding protein [Cytophagales bacterium]|nr:ATP-binding protein [Cytophagales bacterium]
MIHRVAFQRLLELAIDFPVICISGARQVGKTTLAKEYLDLKGVEGIYLDMEKPSDYAKLDEAELLFTENSHKCIIIDEVQLRPEVFPIIRALVDEDRERLRFILLGSVSPALIRSTESLAGRIAYLELHPLDITEIPDEELAVHHFRGGFPRSILARTDKVSKIWLDSFIQSYIEKDFPLLGIQASATKVRKLWEMLAWQTGSLVNYQALGNSLDLSNNTISNYLDFMEGVYMITRLQPFFFTSTKRLVKSPKIYVKDTGVLHRLMRMEDFDQLTGTPQLGHSWEAFVLEQIKACLDTDLSLYFYRTHAGAEVDLVIVKGLEPIATVEIKYSSAPSLTKGHLNSIEDLGTKKNFVVIPKNEDYSIKENIRVCGLRVFIEKYLRAL